MVAQAFNPSTQEAEVGESLRGLQREFQDSQECYTDKALGVGEEGTPTV